MQVLLLVVSTATVATFHAKLVVLLLLMFYYARAVIIYNNMFEVGFQAVNFRRSIKSACTPLSALIPEANSNAKIPRVSICVEVCIRPYFLCCRCSGRKNQNTVPYHFMPFK